MATVRDLVALLAEHSPDTEVDILGDGGDGWISLTGDAKTCGDIGIRSDGLLHFTPATCVTSAPRAASTDAQPPTT